MGPSSFCFTRHFIFFHPATVPQDEATEVATFSLTLPRFFNPESSGLQEQAVPDDLYTAVLTLLSDTFGGCAVEENQLGISSYPDPEDISNRIRYRDIERRIYVDVPIEKVAKAYQLFARWCPIWAVRFRQRHLYLRCTTRGSTWVVRFSPIPIDHPDN